MFLLDFMRYLRGNVQFQAQGDFVERFLNLAARDRVPVWDSHKQGEAFLARTDAASYRKLRRHARKSGVRLHVVEKQGFPFTKRRYRRRKGILIGLGIFAAFLMVMSSFIWRIEVHGNDKVSESRVIEALDTLGIRPGTLRRSIDVRDSERRALLLLQDLSWIALNIDGSTIYVEVNERVEKPEEWIDPGIPCNIVATHDGQIVAMNVFEGQAMAMVGDGVAAGDVVVSGITQDRLGQNLFKHARAEVIAEVRHEIQVEIPLAQVRYRETGDVRRRSYLGIFSYDLPLFIPLQVPHPYHVERERTPLQVLSATLPLSHFKETYVLMEEVPVTLDEEEAKALALRELNAVELVELDGAEILERTAAAGIQGDHFVIRAEYLCHMDIAAKKEIGIAGSDE